MKNDKPIKVKSRIFPRKSYWTSYKLSETNKKKKSLIEKGKNDPSADRITNIIEGTYRSFSKKGRSIIINYFDIFGNKKMIALTKLMKMGVVPKTIAVDALFGEEEKISKYFSNNSFNFLMFTISDPYITPALVVDLLKDYFYNYLRIRKDKKKLFLRIVKDAGIIRHDLFNNLDSIERINQILFGLKAKPAEFIQIKEDPKLLNGKRKRAPYGSTKVIILELATTMEIKQGVTPSKEEVLIISRHLKHFHDINASESSIRKILHRAGYSAKR